MTDTRSRATLPAAPTLSEAELHETLDLMGKLMASLSERIDRQSELLDALASFAEAVLSDNPPLTPTRDAEEQARRIGARLEAHIGRALQDLHRLQASFHADVGSAHAVFDAVREHRIALRQELFRKEFKPRFWDRPALLEPGSSRGCGGAPSRTGRSPSRDEAAGRHPRAALGRISGRSSRGLRLLPVLRAITAAGGAALAGHAPAPCRGRAGCSSTIPARRLAVIDPATGAVAPGGDLHRRARGLELHLCRGELEPDAAGLDRRPCPRVRLLRRRCRRWSCPTI